jgi:hypothetical protein
VDKHVQFSVLRETVRWGERRPPPRRLPSLSDAEQAFVRLALRALRIKYRTAANLARALGMSRTTVAQSIGSYPVSPELAIRSAKLAGVPVSDVLTGAWPGPRVCRTCGQPMTEK